MKYLAIIYIALMMTACTYSITQVHTEGQASDVVDEPVTTTPTFTIPFKAV